MNFVADNLAALVGAHEVAQDRLAASDLVLHLSTSPHFVDLRRVAKPKPMSFREFALFASFFPQLLAGPIVHYGEMVPQFESRRFGQLNWRNILVAW